MGYLGLVFCWVKTSEISREERQVAKWTGIILSDQKENKKEKQKDPFVM